MTTFRSARALRRGALALTLGLGLVASACAPEPTPPTPNQAAAHNAGVWMNAQFTAGHAFPGPFGGESAVSAAEAIADLDALGVGQAQQADRLARLEADTPAAITDGTNDVPGNLARIILAVVATGGNPRAFAGLDLVARLEATVGVDGRFGAQSPLYDGVYRQGLALAALSVVTPRPASITPERVRAWPTCPRSRGWPTSSAATARGWPTGPTPPPRASRTPPRGPTRTPTPRRWPPWA